MCCELVGLNGDKAKKERERRLTSNNHSTNTNTTIDIDDARFIYTRTGEARDADDLGHARLLHGGHQVLHAPVVDEVRVVLRVDLFRGQEGRRQRQQQVRRLGDAARAAGGGVVVVVVVFVWR